MSVKADKKTLVQTGVELLSEVSRLPVEHVSIAPYQLTPYDAYCKFIAKVKEEIPRETLLQLQPGCDPDATVEQILTPNFVCSLAFKWMTKVFRVSV